MPQDVDLRWLRRPGRLETEVCMGMPSHSERMEIVEALLERSKVITKGTGK
jgi:SpoVK/Ycf46/Vps4 family AAA+-type ATPase